MTWKPEAAEPISTWRPSSAIPAERTRLPQATLTTGWQPKSAIPAISPQDPEATLGQATDFFKEPHPAFQAMGKGAELAEKGIGLGKEGMFNTLGLIGYPFKAMGHTIATPEVPLTKATWTILSLRKLNAPEELISEVGSLVKSIPEAAWTGLTSWGHLYKTPEGAKTMDDVTDAYWEGLTGEKPPDWWKKATGTGMSFLTIPLAVSKLFKAFGATYNALPWVQRGQKQRQLWHRLLTRARGRTEGRIEAASELAKSIGKKESLKIAEELSYKTGTKITPQAVQKRLAQIISGSVTTQKSLTTKANPIIDEFRSNYKILQNYGIIGKETFLTKLPKKRIAELLKQKVQLQTRIGKLQKVPYQEALLKSVKNLTPDLNKQKRLADKFVNIAIKAEARGKKLSQMGDDFIDAAIEVTTGSPLSKRIATLMDFMPGDKRLTILGKRILSLEKMGRASRDKAANEILKQAAKINPKVSKYVNQTVNDILTVASQIDDTKIIGQATLLKKIASMKRQFPGKAKRIAELQGKIDDIEMKVLQSAHPGATITRLPDGRLSIEGGATEYFPRMYLEKETGVRRRLPFGAKRIRAPYAKQRKDIPFEVRRGMGEIKTAPYPVHKRLIQEAADIETAKLFKQVERIGLSSKTPKGNWKQLPEGKPYGVLSKNFVPPRVYDDITAMAQIKSNFGQMYDITIGNWKASKVLWNPATHFRNMLSNSILLDLSGMNHASQLKYLKKASQEIIKNTKEYDFARKMFARTTLSRGELMDDMLQMTKAAEGKGSLMQKVLNYASAGSKKASKVPASIYAREEFIGKFMKYLEQRSLGKSPMASIEQANKWLFDYSDLAGLEKTVARRVMPFYTFPRKAIPRVAEAITERPYTFAKYPLLASSMTKYSLSKLEISDKDYEEIKKALPEYMQRGSYVLMPYRDKNNDLRFFDWTYIIPWGPVNEIQERGALGFFVTNPFVQAVGDIQRNKDSFTGKKIWDDSIPENQWTPEYRKEQNYKKLEHLWRIALPSLAYKGIYWDKLRDAALGIPTKTGKKRLLPETIAHTVFGLRTQPIDVKESQKWRFFEKKKGIQELRKQMRDAAIREGIGNISSEELDRRLKIYMNQAQRIGQQ